MKPIILTVLALLLSLINLHAQLIQGTVTDNKKEPIINATVAIKQNGILKGGAITDIDGKFSTRLTDSGRYDVTVNYLGYQTATMVNVMASQADTTGVNFVLKQEKEYKITTCYYIHCCWPRLQPYKTSYYITTAQMRGVNMMKD